MYAIYTAVLSVGLAAALPFYAARFGKYLPTLGERLGLGPRLAREGSIWIHAVSVGEVRAVEPLVARIRERFPDRPIVLSTTTPTGRALANARKDADLVLYFPFDLPGSIRRCLAKVRPQTVIVAETEIWPNFLRICASKNIPVFLVNGRISDRSYRRYRIARRWLPRVLADFRLLAMQSESDADRIRTLGAPSDRVVVLGNLKYDDPAGPPNVSETLQALLAGDAATQPLVVAASTAEGEEGMVLEAFARVRASIPGARLLIAPRRTERFDAVHRLVVERGFQCARRSETGEESEWQGDVFLLDSIGELPGVFGSAAVVFMGGTLVPKGGHNVLEPARFGRPILFGPHMENFREIARTFLSRNAGVEVKGTEDLAARITEVLTDPALAGRLGENARRVAEANRGATGRTMEAVFGPAPAGADR